MHGERDCVSERIMITSVVIEFQRKEKKKKNGKERTDFSVWCLESNEGSYTYTIELLFMAGNGVLVAVPHQI